MKTLTGKLTFFSIFHPIMLNEMDLRNEIWSVLQNLNGKPASMKNGMNMIEIHADENSERLMEFKKNDVEESIHMIFINKPDTPISISNLGYYIEDMLQRLNGMQVITTITSDSIKFEHDENEKVFELKYTNNNSCKIPEDKVNEICRPGEKDCCIFLTMSSEGFTCDKFNNPIARVLLDRHSRGTMRANRIGNCKIVGRIL